MRKKEKGTMPSLRLASTFTRYFPQLYPSSLFISHCRLSNERNLLLTQERERERENVLSELATIDLLSLSLSVTVNTEVVRR